MKKYIVLLLLLSPCSNTFLFGKMVFGSGGSAFKIGDSGRLHVGKSIIDVDGTIFKGDSAQITSTAGTYIGFNRGYLESKAVDLLLTATYTATTNPNTITLSGNQSLRAQPGQVIENLLVSSGNNRISGIPTFSSPIIFDGDANTTLTLAIYSYLNKDIYLNSGIMFLESDLNLSDGVDIKGTGTVKLNNKSLGFGGIDMSMSEQIYWDSASGLQMNSNVNLSALWTFSGVCIFNGKGNTLDLTNHGTVMVEEGSVLYITNMVLRGIGDGGLRCLGPTSKIVFSNVDLELTQTYTLLMGGIYVQGPTTFLLQDKNWYFSGISSLTVDGTVLWTDRRGTPTEQSGKILFGTPIENYFTSLSSGTIKEKVYYSDVESLQDAVNVNAGNIAVLQGQMITAETDINNLELGLASTYASLLSTSNWLSYELSNTYDSLVSTSNWLSTSLTNTYKDLSSKISQGGGGGDSPLAIYSPLFSSTVVDRSSFINPKDTIEIAADLTINGSGAILLFANADHAQFKVRPDKAVRLEHITLQNVNSKTFDIATSSRIEIGKNVTFSIGENMTFASGQIVVTEGGTLTLQGMDRTRQVPFVGSFFKPANPLDRYARRAFNASLPIVLEANATLILQGIEFNSASQICAESGAKVKLTGGGTMLVDKNSGLSFMIEDTNNTICFVQNNAALTGRLAFGDSGYNSVHFSHRVTGTVLAKPGVQFGDAFAFVASTLGKAEISFDEDWVSVNNAGAHAFVLGANSILKGKTIDISHNPIMRTSAIVELSSGLTLTSSDLPSPIVDGDSSYIPPTRAAMFDGESAVPTHKVTDFVAVRHDHTVEKLVKPRAPSFRSLLVDEQGESHAIIVSGKENVVVVDRKITLDEPIIFEPDSHLTFVFDPQAEFAQLLFGAHAAINFAASSCLEFAGTGTVMWHSENEVISNDEVAEQLPTVIWPETVSFVMIYPEVASEKPVSCIE